MPHTFWIFLKYPYAPCFPGKASTTYSLLKIISKHSAYRVYLLFFVLTRTSYNVWNVLLPGNHPIWYLTTVKICTKKHKFYIYNISTTLHISKYGITDQVGVCLQNFYIFHYSSLINISFHVFLIL